LFAEIRTNPKNTDLENVKQPKTTQSKNT